MIFLRFSKTVLEANTYVLADDDARVALVVDTGAGSSAWIKEALEARGLTLGAVLLTHGHADHVWDASAVATAQPVYIPEPDLYRLDDPIQYITKLPGVAAMLKQFGQSEWIRPDTAQALPAEAFSGDFEIVPNIFLRAIPAPGHSEGSTVFILQGAVGNDPERATSASEEPVKIMLAGDVIFNNGIGRTDLPGSDPESMKESLRTLIQVIDPATRVFPGHGPETTMGREASSSPYLRAALM